jgi:hypothetical protein
MTSRNFAKYKSMHFKLPFFYQVTREVHLRFISVYPTCFSPDVDHHISRLCALLYHDEPKVWL